MADQFDRKSRKNQIVELAADIVSAYVRKNPVPIGQLPSLIGDVHRALASIQAAQNKKAEPLIPAVSIKKSITPNYIISLEDGQKFKSLKRHLMAAYGMTPGDYRAKWGLPSDYPMMAPGYAAERSQIAKRSGLGLNPAPAPVSKTRARKKAR